MILLRQEKRLMANDGAVVIVDGKEDRFDHAIAENGALWLEARELARRTGWELKPQGLCRGELCFLLADGAALTSTREGSTYVNFTALANEVGFPWVCNLQHRTWYFGPDPNARATALKSLKAPDFELPDIDGLVHRLSDNLGKKTLLVSWASW